MSSFYCTFCHGQVYMASLYSPFGDGGLAICEDCIILGVEEILQIDHGPEGEDFIGRLAWAILRAKAQDAELEGLAPQEVIELAKTQAEQERQSRDMTPGG